MKCIFLEFQYHPTYRHLIYYFLISGPLNRLRRVHWQSLTSDDVSLISKIPSSDN